jgi:hypothetical protein
MGAQHNGSGGPPRATYVDTTIKEHVFDLVNTHASNIDSADKAALRVVNRECMRFVSENATKLSYKVRIFEDF